MVKMFEQGLFINETVLRSNQSHFSRYITCRVNFSFLRYL